jgi:hypothetical protein
MAHGKNPMLSPRPQRVKKSSLECGSDSFRFSFASKACNVVIPYGFSWFGARNKYRRRSKEEDLYRKLRLRMKSGSYRFRTP